MNQKQWEPLTTAEAVIEAIKAGRHVEFTPCGCDYQLPSCKDTFSGSGGWVIPEYEDEYDMLTAVKGPEAPDDSFRYRALIAPAQPHSCANCLGVDPASCMFALAQPAADEMRGGAVEPARSGWQPIETAPKDGTRFLAFSRVPRLRSPYFVVEIDSDGVLRRVDTNQAARSVTHWMPLPEPPNE